MEQRLKIAVFVDFDNVEIGVKSRLQREFDLAAMLDALKERGRDRHHFRVCEPGQAGIGHALSLRARRTNGATRSPQGSILREAPWCAVLL